MDKITHQIRAKHWAKIMNECIAECLKLPGAGQMGSQKNSSSSGKGSCAGKLSRIPGMASLPAAVRPDQELAPVTQRTVSFTELKLPSSPPNTAPVFRPDLVI